ISPNRPASNSPRALGVLSTAPGAIVASDAGFQGTPAGARITRTQRFTKDNPCPICNGFDGAPRGRGLRCHGFISDDGAYAHCTREEHAGSLMKSAAGTYAHRTAGPCKCGSQHNAALPAT